MNRLLWMTLVSLCCAVACGGSSAGKGSANDADSAGAGESDPDHSASGVGGEAESGPALPSCDDGTCFRCGESICPKGFYCDRDAQGGPACGWLPACAEEATCSCVKQAIGGTCSCEEQTGGPVLDCD